MPCFLLTEPAFAGNAYVPIVLGAAMMILYCFNDARNRTLEITFLGQKREEKFRFMVRKGEYNLVLLVYCICYLAIYFSLLFIFQNVFKGNSFIPIDSDYMNFVFDVCEVEHKNLEELVNWYWPVVLSAAVVGSVTLGPSIPLEKLKIQFPKVDLFVFSQYIVGVKDKYFKTLGAISVGEPNPMFVDQSGGPDKIRNKITLIEKYLTFLAKETSNNKFQKLTLPSYFNNSTNRSEVIFQVLTTSQSTQAKLEKPGSDEAKLFALVEKDVFRLVSLLLSQIVSIRSITAYLFPYQIFASLYNEHDDIYDKMAKITFCVIFVSILFTYVPVILLDLIDKQQLLGVFGLTELSSLIPSDENSAGALFFSIVFLHVFAIYGSWVFRSQYGSVNWYRFEDATPKLPSLVLYSAAMSSGYIFSFIATIFIQTLLQWNNIFASHSLLNFWDIAVPTAFSVIISLPTSFFFLYNYDLAELGLKTPARIFVLSLLQFFATLFASYLSLAASLANTKTVVDDKTVDYIFNISDNIDYLIYITAAAMIIVFISGKLTRA